MSRRTSSMLSPVAGRRLCSRRSLKIRTERSARPATGCRDSPGENQHADQRHRQQRKAQDDKSTQALVQEVDGRHKAAHDIVGAAERRPSPEKEQGLLVLQPTGIPSQHRPDIALKRPVGDGDDVGFPDLARCVDDLPREASPVPSEKLLR